MAVIPFPVARILSGDKVIDSKVLNLLGVQPLRTIAARLVYSSRRVEVDSGVERQADDLRNTGLLVIEDFLPPSLFEAVVRECALLDRRADLAVAAAQGSLTQTVIRASDLGPQSCPAIHAFFADSRLTALLNACEKWPFGDLVRHGIYERLSHDAARSRAHSVDPQAELHSDVFFTSHKLWLYLDDVAEEDGPFVYVKGSHQLSARRLWEIYRHSTETIGTADRWRRILPEERRAAETVVTCPANTLVLANVCGYHRRLLLRAGRARRALALTLRNNPFLAHGLRQRLAEHEELHGWLRRAKRMVVPNRRASI